MCKIPIEVWNEKIGYMFMLALLYMHKQIGATRMVVKLSRNFKSADIDVKCYHKLWYWLWSILCSVLIWYASVIVHLYLDYHSISHQCYCLFISMPQKHFIHFIKVVFFIQNIVTVWNVWYRYVVYFKQQQFQVLSILDYCKQKPQPKPVCF